MENKLELYKVIIEDKSFYLPEAIALDENKLKLTVSVHYPTANNAEYKLDKKNKTVTLTKNPGKKG